MMLRLKEQCTLVFPVTSERLLAFKHSCLHCFDWPDELFATSALPVDPQWVGCLVTSRRVCVCPPQQCLTPADTCHGTC